MSVQSRAPARSRPGARTPRLRRDQFLALAASAAAALGLVLTAGPAASAATHTAAPAAPLHTPSRWPPAARPSVAATPPPVSRPRS